MALGVCPTGVLSAQEGAPDRDAPVVERVVESRWLHGRQKARFTLFDSQREWIHLDSAVALPGGGRVVHLRVGGSRRGDAAIMRLGPEGEIAGLEAPVPRRPFRRRGGFDSLEARRARLDRGAGSLGLASARLWDLAPPSLPPSWEPGTEWRDSLDLEARSDGFAQLLRGRRVGRVLGDTLIGERRLPLVWDSADVVYEERRLRDDASLDTVVRVVRRASGTLRGRAVYDPGTGLWGRRHDTLRLEGRAELAYPDGRRFSTPARFEGTRRWTLHTPETFRARLAELRAERPGGGGLRVPRTELEQRLADGDSLLADSLLAVWRTTQDPGTRQDAERLLTWAPAHPPLLELAFARGDTARWIEQRARSHFYRNRDEPPVTTDDLRFLLPFLEDPGLAFAFGLEIQWLYISPAEALRRNPPALEPDTSRWPCTPDACRLLASQWEEAREPRLRDLGLVTHLVLEPREWVDQVEHRARAGSVLAEEAMTLVRGVGATWPAAPKTSLPEPGARWREWLEWLGGEVRFGGSHSRAIRFREVVTGRDVVEEVRGRYLEAEEDSVRVVFGSILAGMGGLEPTAAEAAEMLQSGPESSRALAHGELRRIFRDGAEPAPPDTAALLVGRLLRIHAGEAERWPVLEGLEGRVYELPSRRPLSERETPPFLLAEDLPESVREAWGERLPLIRRAEWDARVRDPEFERVMWDVGPVRRVGRFFEVSLRVRGRTFWSQTRYRLLATDGGWRLVWTELGMT